MAYSNFAREIFKVLLIIATYITLALLNFYILQLCVQKLGVLIEDSDQNLKYLGLLAMGKILQTHPKAVQAHKDIVLRCLDDKDESIRLRSSFDFVFREVYKIHSCQKYFSEFDRFNMSHPGLKLQRCTKMIEHNI